MNLQNHFQTNNTRIQNFITDVSHKLATNDMSILYSLPCKQFDYLDQCCFSGRPLSHVVYHNYRRLIEQETERLKKLFDNEKNKEGYRDRIEETEDTIREIAYELAMFETTKLNNIYPRTLFLKNPRTEMREVKDKYLDTYDKFFDRYYNQIADLLGYNYSAEDGIAEEALTNDFSDE